MELRQYQSDAVASVYRYLRQHDGNPVVVLPTASGKTPLLSTICRDAVQQWNGRVLVLAHVKELLQQAVDKLKRVAPDLDVGVYSAGLKRRDTNNRVLVAGIQSVYQRACELDAFDLVIIDECHLLPKEGDGMYRQFLADARKVNPHLRVIGLTATPFRMDSGPICDADHFLNDICYEIGVKELIRDGYLCPLVTKNAVTKVDTSNLHVRAGEFVAGEVEDLMDQDDLVAAACEEIVSYTQNRKSVLIFAAGVRHGRHVVDVLKQNHEIECGFVCGETPAKERDETLARFRGELNDGLFQREPLRFLCNVNVLTVGFDNPRIDCVVLLRPTASPVLYCQAVGRGFRLHLGKLDCLVLDFGGNIERHGPVDALRLKPKKGQGGEAPAKECPDCHTVVAAGYSVCPDCGHEFPPPERGQHEAHASKAGILSGQVTTEVYEVKDEYYRVHSKRGADEDAPKTMRVEYQVGLDRWQSEFICFEHQGWARRKAEAWWRERSSLPAPETAEEAVQLAADGALCLTRSITVRTVAGEPYSSIVGHELDREAVSVGRVDDDIPF